MDNALSVAVCAKFVTGLKFAIQLQVIVDFAVECNPDLSGFVRQRLLAGTEIDNAEAAVAQPDTGPDIDAVLIGTPMTDNVCHFANSMTVYWRPV
jgi:hypothetical protein